ncbi:MAG TPA: NAD(P)/FAD-dependent oxidoreductase [Geobacteraceae bacterium]|nr:NAD(P)/FAD-dependent oxidoreductase [Geobacteraceae bacterium]
MREPITIVGAGPAGITAAIVLRRHGIPVRVYEKFPDAGYRLNGDFQGFENWSSEQDITDLLKEIGIIPNFLLVPYHCGTVYAPGMKPVTVTSGRPIFYLVKRGAVPGSLDFGLRAQAEALGVEFVFNHRVDNFDRMSIVGTGPSGADAVAIGMTFETSWDDTAIVAFNDDLAHGGYAYLLVHGGRGTMASVLYGEGMAEREAFGRMVDFFQRELCLEIRNERRFSGFASFFLRDSQVVRKCLYVGESAGFQDCLWGFGMRYAMLSGYLAASSILKGVSYDRLWKKALRPMLETSLVNRYLIELFGAVGYRYLARRFDSGDPCVFLRRHYNYSLGKHLLLPFAKRALRGRFQLREVMSS